MFTHNNKTYTQFGDYIPCKMVSSTPKILQLQALDNFCETHPNQNLIPSELERLTDSDSSEWSKVRIAKGSIIHVLLNDNIPMINGIHVVNVHTILLVELPT